LYIIYDTWFLSKREFIISHVMKSLFRIYIQTRKSVYIYIYIYICIYMYICIHVYILQWGWKTFSETLGVTWRVSWTKFHTQDPQTLGANVQYLVARATWNPGFMYSCAIVTYTFYDFLSSLRPCQWPLSINIPSQNIMYISCLPSTWPTYANQTCVFETHNSSAYIPTANTALRVKRYMSFLTLNAKYLHHPQNIIYKLSCKYKERYPFWLFNHGEGWRLEFSGLWEYYTISTANQLQACLRSLMYQYSV
jgi:hypothetical protein